MSHNASLPQTESIHYSVTHAAVQSSLPPSSVNEVSWTTSNADHLNSDVLNLHYLNTQYYNES